jgi:hypothetical protein
MLYGALKQALWFTDILCPGQGLFLNLSCFKNWQKNLIYPDFRKIELSRFEEMEFASFIAHRLVVLAFTNYFYFFVYGMSQHYFTGMKRLIQ